MTGAAVYGGMGGNDRYCTHSVLINSMNVSIHNHFKFSRKKYNEDVCLAELIMLVIQWKLIVKFSGKKPVHCSLYTVLDFTVAVARKLLL